MKQIYFKAIFLEEANNRFICTVLKDKQAVECYISSSSKLSNYLPLVNCNILISKNKGKNLRTKYTLEAVEHNKIIYYVNFNKINNLYKTYLLADELENRKFHKEYLVDNTIKTDFYFENNECVEIKVLLSKTNKVVFPDNSSCRLESQLLKYIELLKKNVHVTFCFIAMSSSITSFELNTKKKNTEANFFEAISLGMQIKAYSVIYKNENFKLIENSTLAHNILTALKS